MIVKAIQNNRKQYKIIESNIKSNIESNINSVGDQYTKGMSDNNE